MHVSSTDHMPAMVHGGRRHHGEHAEASQRAQRNHAAQGRGHLHRNAETQKAAKSHAGRHAEGRSDVAENASTETVASEAKGVVRLIEAGHFKGVAAVRLSMNFHAELTARRSSAAATEIESAAAEFTDGVSEAFAAASEAPAQGEVPTTTLADEAFTNEIAEVVSGFRSGRLDATAALAAFQMTFDNLASRLDVVPVEADESSADEGEEAAEVVSEIADPAEATETTEAAAAGVGAVVDGPEEVAVPETAAPIGSESGSTAGAAASSLMETLGQLFGEFMEDVHSALDTMNSVTEFARPTGSGVAFEKFLAMYREMAAPVDAGSGDESSVAAEAGGIDQLV